MWKQSQREETNTAPLGDVRMPAFPPPAWQPRTRTSSLPWDTASRVSTLPVYESSGYDPPNLNHPAVLTSEPEEASDITAGGEAFTFIQFSAAYR
jgi:hypothetical protein